MIVPNIDSVPSSLSTISTTRDCCGQSMCDAVLISQKPLPAAQPRGRGKGLTMLRWVWPFTHATTFGYCSSLLARRFGR